MTTLAEAISELPAGERATNTTISYEFKLDGGLSEDEVRAEVRRRYPVFRRVEAHHHETLPTRPAYWWVEVTLRKEW